MNALSARERLIVALDMADAARARELVDRIGDAAGVYKIGLTLAAAGGLDLARELKRAGRGVFLDLKFYDIPAQVESAVRACADWGVDFLTVHARPRVLEAAARGAAGTQACILGVTVLTAFDQKDLAEAGIVTPIAQLVLKRAAQAMDAGAGGVVASPLEAAAIAARAAADFEIVTPGVRPAGADHGDQKRVARPAEAIEAGATRLVVGRPITSAADPRAAAEAVAAEIAEAAARPSQKS